MGSDERHYPVQAYRFYELVCDVRGISFGIASFILLALNVLFLDLIGFSRESVFLSQAYFAGGGISVYVCSCIAFLNSLVQDYVVRLLAIELVLNDFRNLIASPFKCVNRWLVFNVSCGAYVMHYGYNLALVNTTLRSVSIERPFAPRIAQISRNEANVKFIDQHAFVIAGMWFVTVAGYASFKSSKLGTGGVDGIGSFA